MTNSSMFEVNSPTKVPMMSPSNLGVFGAMLGASAIIGVYFGCCSGRKQSASEYLMGGKSMDIVPIALSLVASFISGITVLGVPTEIYLHGTQYWLVVLSGFLVTFVIAVGYVPVYIDLQLDSCYQYLELRFNKRVRRLASIIFVCAQFLTMPIVIYVPALAFSQVTGINVHLITPITCLVCIFYTTLGGLRAVVWADTLQTVLMFAATIVVLALGTTQLGGWSKVWERSEQGHRLEFFNFNPSPLERHTVWTVFIGSFFLDLGCVTNQGMVQRVLAVPNLRSAQWSLFWFSIGFAAIKAIGILMGLFLYAYYADCDPLSSKRVQRADQLLPLLVLETTSHLPGLSGLFLAGVFSAALSTMSTSLNALSGVLVDDLLAGWLPYKLISRGAWLRVAAMISGVICVALVFVVEHLGGVLQVTLSFNGITIGTMLGIFTLGMFFPKANSKGALAGATASLLLVGCLVVSTKVAIARGELRPHNLPVSVAACPGNISLAETPSVIDFEVWPLLRLSYMYYSLLGCLIVLLVGLPVSSWSRDEHEKCDPRLISPLVRDFVVTTEKSASELLQPLSLQPRRNSKFSA